MAYFADNTSTHSLSGGLTRALADLGNFIVNLAESNSKVRAVNALNALSDEQLAERGLKREDIVYHVFGNHFYI